MGGFAYSHYNTQQPSLSSESASVQVMRDHIAIQLRAAEKDVRMLSREVSALQTIVEERQTEKEEQEAAQLNGATEKLKEARSQLKALKNHAEQYAAEAISLRETVQSYSKRRVEQSYGRGKKLFVELTLQFPDNNSGPDTILVEMALLEAMPHSVHFFLDMVSRGLWDGCSFVINALHVLKAALLPYDANSNIDPASHFKAASLNGPVFKEQSNLYPHSQYTLGFAGIDSPAFYINTDDNSELHAGDSAFGKLVSGTDTLDRLNKAPTQNGIWFRENIGIKSARVVVEKTPDKTSALHADP